jgi:hypothetical protein
MTTPTNADDTGIAFGDSVRIVATPLTESLGFAGRVDVLRLHNSLGDWR